MFVGQYIHTLDAKKRAMIPAKFRELLEEKKSLNRVYVIVSKKALSSEHTPPPFVSFLQCYPEEVWQNLIDKIQNNPEPFSSPPQTVRKSNPKISFPTLLGGISPISGTQQDVLRKIMWDTDYLNLDPQGRIVLPKRLVEQASLEKEILIAGLGAWFEIWDHSAWKRVNEELTQRLPPSIKET